MDYSDTEFVKIEPVIGLRTKNPNRLLPRKITCCSRREEQIAVAVPFAIPTLAKADIKHVANIISNRV